jgi:hypothetical protein
MNPDPSKPILPTLAFVLLLLPAALPAPPVEQRSYDKDLAAADLNKLMVRYDKGLDISIKGPGKAMRISCPIGVLCDSSYYRAYRYTHQIGRDLSIFVYVSFENSLLGKLKGRAANAAVQKNFAYVYYILSSRRWGDMPAMIPYKPVSSYWL